MSRYLNMPIVALSMAGGEVEVIPPPIAGFCIELLRLAWQNNVGTLWEWGMGTAPGFTTTIGALNGTSNFTMTDSYKGAGGGISGFLLDAASGLYVDNATSTGTLNGHVTYRLIGL